MLVIKFKFDEYPEIKAKHEVFAKLEKDAYSAEIEYEESGDEALSEKWSDLLDKLEEFNNSEYAFAIFNTFAKQNPKLLVMGGKRTVWKDVFGLDFEALSDDEKSELIPICEGGGAYRLTKEYYEEVEIDNVTLKERKTKRRLSDEDLCK